MSGSQFQQFNEDLNKMLGSTLPLCPFTTKKGAFFAAQKRLWSMTVDSLNLPCSQQCFVLYPINKQTTYDQLLEQILEKEALQQGKELLLVPFEPGY